MSLKILAAREQWGGPVHLHGAAAAVCCLFYFRLSFLLELPDQSRRNLHTLATFPAGTPLSVPEQHLRSATLACSTTGTLESSVIQALLKGVAL